MKQRIIAALLFVGAVSRADNCFVYRVERDGLIRDEQGELRIDNSGIWYKSVNGKTTLHILLRDVRQADVSDPRVIRIETYDMLKRKLTGRRQFVFRLLDRVHEEALTRFLVTNLQRPVIGSYGSAQSSATSIAAYHRHRLGGCHGNLHIDSTAIRFTGETPSESRTWLYSEIETVGSMNAFHFRVSTLAETYNIDLKEKLPELAYDLATRSVYRLLHLRSAPAVQPFTLK